MTGISSREAENHFEAQSSKGACLEAHGQLPATQPGSSIMPGKVNPVMSEPVTLFAACLLESISLLGNVASIFCTRWIGGIQADAARCQELIELSLSMVTALAPRLG